MASIPVLVAGLSDNRDMLFCEDYARNHDGVRAAIRAGIKTGDMAVGIIAQRMLGRPEIKTAISIIEQAHRDVDPPEVTRDSIVADMQEVYQSAMNVGDRDQAINAKRLQSQLLGLLIEKKEVTLKRGVDDYTTAELARIVDKAKTIDAEFEEVVDDGEADGADAV